MQKESLLFFSFPSDSNFGKARITIKRVKRQIYLNFSLASHFHSPSPLGEGRGEVPLFYRLRKLPSIFHTILKICIIRNPKFANIFTHNLKSCLFQMFRN